MNERYESICKDWIKKYYEAKTVDEKADAFFTIVSIYEQLKAKGYESQTMTQLSNIIVLG